MACIHYKFKNSLDFDSITFDGLHISVRDLKLAIMQRKKLNDTDMDLLIINALNAKAYKDEDEMIPKNASVIVARIPMSDAPRSKGPKTLNAYKEDPKPQPQVQMPDPKVDKDNLAEVADLVTAHGSEEEKIKAMMKQSTKDFDPANYQKKLPTGTPSPSYVCFKCNRTGHFIHNCPNAAVTSDSASGSPKMTETEAINRMKRPTGIPHTFLTTVNVNKSDQGAMSLGDGRFAVPTIDHEAFKKGKKERPPFLPAPPEEKKVEDIAVPSELTCVLCKDLITDAVVIPCCGNSYCDDCIRNYLVEDEDHKCPSCGEENVSPDKLIINKSLRVSVNNFKNETLYQKKAKKRTPSPPPPPLPKATSSSLRVDTSLKTIDLTNDVDPEPETPVLDEIEDVKGIAVLRGRKAITTVPEKSTTTSTTRLPDTQPTTSVDNITSTSVLPQAPIPSIGYRPNIPMAPLPNTALPPPGYRPPILYPGILTPAFPVPPAFIPPQVSKPLSEHEFYREKKRLLAKSNPLDDYTRPSTDKKDIKKSKSLSPKGRAKSSRSRSRSPTKKDKSFSRSPPPKKRSFTKSRSRSPYRKKKSYSRSRSRSRSITPRRRSRSPRFRSRTRSLTPRPRSRSWTPKKLRGRSRSFTRSRSRSRTPRFRRRSFSRTPPYRRRSYSRSLTPRRSRSPPRRRSRSPFYRGRGRSPGYYGREWSPYRGGYRSPPRGYSPTRYGPQGYGYGRDYPPRFDPRMYEELFQDYISRFGLPPPPPPQAPGKRKMYFDPQKGVYRGGTRSKSRSRSPKSRKHNEKNRRGKDDKSSKSKDKKSEKTSKSKNKKDEEKPKDSNERLKEKTERQQEKTNNTKTKKNLDTSNTDIKTETTNTKNQEKKIVSKKTIKKVVKLKDGTIVKKESLALRLKKNPAAGKSPVKGKAEDVERAGGSLSKLGLVKSTDDVTSVKPHSNRPGSNLIEINTRQALPEVKKKHDTITSDEKDKLHEELSVNAKDVKNEENINENVDNTHQQPPAMTDIKINESEKEGSSKQPLQSISSLVSPKKVSPKKKVVKKVQKMRKIEVEASLSDSASDLDKVKTRKKKRVEEVNHESSAEESPAKRIKKEEEELEENRELMLSPPILSKWEREDLDEDKSPDLRDKLKNKNEKKPLPRSIIESAEKAITQKQPKPATIASAVVTTKPQKKISVHDRLQKSPTFNNEDNKSTKQSRRVYMDNEQSSLTEEKNRKVHSRENSMQITVSSDRDKDSKETDKVSKRSDSEFHDREKLVSKSRKTKGEKLLKLISESEKDDKIDSLKEPSDKKTKPRISRQDSEKSFQANRKDENASQNEKSRDNKSGLEEHVKNFEKSEGETIKKKKIERKESVIDESAFVPDYNEHSDSDKASEADGSSASEEEEKMEKKHKKHKKEKKHKKTKKHKKEKKKKKKHKKHKEENEDKVE